MWITWGDTQPVSGTRRPGVLRREEFMFQNAHDGVELRGTLTIPDREGPHPAVVWVHGSGKTERGGAMFFPEYPAVARFGGVRHS